MKDGSDFYFGSWKLVTCVLCVGAVSLISVLETGLLLLPPPSRATDLRDGSHESLFYTVGTDN